MYLIRVRLPVGLIFACCRGLDNRTYYMLAPSGEYYNNSGS